MSNISYYMPTFARLNMEKLWSKAHSAPKTSQYPKALEITT